MSNFSSKIKQMLILVIIIAYEKTVLFLEYNNIIKEQSNLNRVEPVIDYQLNKTHLLHCPVVKENRQTTKVSMVFDASCKGKSKQSLNDTLNPGSSLTPLLSDVLLRFRSINYVTIGNLEK